MQAPFASNTMHQHLNSAKARVMEPEQSWMSYPYSTAVEKNVVLDTSALDTSQEDELLRANRVNSLV